MGVASMITYMTLQLFREHKCIMTVWNEDVVLNILTSDEGV